MTTPKLLERPTRPLVFTKESSEKYKQDLDNWTELRLHLTELADSKTHMNGVCFVVGFVCGVLPQILMWVW